MFFTEFVYWCEQKGVTPNKAAVECGFSEASPSYWKRTGSTPKGENLKKIADYFGITVNSLIDHTIAVPTPSFNGDIATRVSPYTATPTEPKKTVVYASDNAMIFDCIPKGAEITIIPTTEIDDGEIVAVIYQGNTFIRRFHRQDGNIILSSSNPKYSPIITTTETLKETGDGIIGICDKVTFHLK